MRGEVKIRNWDKWQSYRSDRGQPPWIKVHRRLMQDPNWIELTDAQRGQLVAMWMLAADRNGVIPASPATIRKLCGMDSDPDLQVFVEKGFLELDANVASLRRQHDRPDTEEEEDTDKENNRIKTPRMELLATLDAEHAQAVIEHRQRLRKPLTPRAAKMLAAALGKAPDPNAAADTMILRGWLGFDPDWLKGVQKGRYVVQGPRRTFAEIKAERERDGTVVCGDDEGQERTPGKPTLEGAGLRNILSASQGLDDTEEDQAERVDKAVLN